LISIISSGLSAVSGILATVNSTLQNVIGPLLRSISGAMAAIQSITQGILDFQQNIVYPLAAINSARGLVGQVQGIYNSIRGIWNTVVRSATLVNPQVLENVILSKDAGQIGTVAARFSAVYTRCWSRPRYVDST
jgi:phage-related protein